MIGFVVELFDNEVASSMGLYITLALSESRLPDVVDVSLWLPPSEILIDNYYFDTKRHLTMIYGNSACCKVIIH